MKNSDLAKIIDEAALNANPIAQLTTQKKITLEDAYDIQSKSLQERYKRGEKFIGYKMGFTSKAKMEQMGVHELIWGRLTDKMLINRGGQINIHKFIHPRAEPEICFLVKKKIDKPINSIEEAKEYIAGYAAAIEIIDSRFINFNFTLEDVVADNCSSAGLILGPWNPIEEPLTNLKIKMEFNGKVVHEGNSNAILENPWESLFRATKLVTDYGEKIPYGSYIMAGAATPAEYLDEGMHIKATVEKLGEVEFSTLPPFDPPSI